MNSHSTFAATTVITANYLSHARTLFQSIKKFHPGAHCAALLIDKVEKRFDPSDEDFEIIPVETLNLSDLRQLLFKYTPWERVMFFKPVVLKTMLKRLAHINKFFYFDSDCFVTGSLQVALTELDDCNLLLTPHFLKQVPDARKINELLFLRIGIFNLGFLGIRRTETGINFLSWWEKKLKWGCFSNPLNGFFVDQKWIDIVPTLFSRVSIFRHPGYNVATWNVLERPISDAGLSNLYQADGAPLVVFHFSGF